MRSSLVKLLIINYESASTSHNIILIIKEDLNLPPFTVEFGNGNRLQSEVVGQEAIDSTVSTLLVRFCKGRFGHYLQSRPIQVLRAKAKRGLNIPQTASACEFSKAHHKELVPAIELDCMPVAFVAIDTLAEFIFGEERHKLCEDCFTLVHGLRKAAQMPLRKLTSSNRKIIYAL